MLAVITALTLMLAGCGLRSPEELYTPPKPTAEYESLQASLEKIQSEGYEYTAPVSGSNTQSVQLEDLDGDGEDEAIAFFRDSSGQERPLKICIFHTEDEGGYELFAEIEGDGDAINSVVYCQLNDTGKSPTQEIVVGWRISSTVYALSAYSIENGNVTELMSAPSYTQYAVRDLDQDNQAEIVSIQMNSAEGGGNTATYYDWTEDTMMSVNKVPLSVSMDVLETVQYNYLVSSYPALYVTGFYQDGLSMVITDILTVSGGKLANITMDGGLVDSSTARLDLSDSELTEPKDINSDNVLELPMPVPLRSVSAVDNSNSYYAIDWVQYTVEGQAQSVGYTFHNTADGWYLNLPQNWVDGLVVGRSDTNIGATVEWSITFYYQKEVTDTPEPFLTIYKNTGTNRTSRATMGERFLLAEEEEATYSAEFFACGWSCGLNEKSLPQRFHLIMNSWSTD